MKKLALYATGLGLLLFGLAVLAYVGFVGMLGYADSVYSPGRPMWDLLALVVIGLLFAALPILGAFACFRAASVIDRSEREPEMPSVSATPTASPKAESHR
jgi:hypothetical protein